MSSPSEEWRNPPSPTTTRRRGSNSYSQQHRKGAASVAKNAYTSHAGSLHALIQAAVVEAHTAESPVSVDVSDPSSSSAAYLASLSTQSLESLQSQPELLASSSNKINDQLSLLCQRQVGSLVQVHRSSSSIPSALSSIQTSLDQLLQTSLPHLAQVTSAFATNTQQPIAIRTRAAKLIQAHNAQLSDLLNIPQLITTCVRSGFYTEALQLADHVATLASKESPLAAGPTLQALRDEAWRALASMRAQLLNAFAAQPLGLASAKRIINNLRKLRDLDQANAHLPSSSCLSLSEEELCTALLRARSHLLHQALLSPIEAQTAAGRQSSNPSQHISAAHLQAYIDVWTHGVQETVSITQRLFSDLPSFSHHALSSFVHLYLGLLRKEIAAFLPKLLESLSQACSKDPLDSTYRQVSTLLDETANALVALHTQLSFAAISLAPLGVDFAQLLDDGTAPVTLQQAAVTLLSQPAQWALNIFHRHLPSSSSPPTPPSTWLIPPQSVPDVIATASAASPSIDTLVHFPPLASFLNNLLLGINALASFAPLSQHQAALHQLDQLLTQLSIQLLDYSRRLPEQAPKRSAATPPAYSLPSLLPSSSSLSEAATRHRYGQAERLLSVLALDVYCSVLVPYVRKGLLVDVFNSHDDGGQEYALPLTAAKEWVQQVKAEWDQGEQSRRLELEAQQKEEMRQREEEEAKRRQEAEERKRIEEEESKRKQMEDEERRRKEEEERRQKEEDERIHKEEEERKRKEEEEEEEETRQREEEETRRKQEEEVRRRQEEEERRRKEEEEEEAARRRQGEQERRQKEEEAERNRAEEEAVKRKVQEEETRRRAAEEEEARRQAQEEEQERKQVEDQEQVKIQAEKQEEEQKRTQLHEEEDSRRKQEQEEEQRKAKEAEAATAKAQDPPPPQQEEHARAEVDAAKPQPESSSATPTATATNSDPPATRKLTLAEKLKIRQEERQRQAAATAAAAAQVQRTTEETPPQTAAKEEPTSTSTGDNNTANEGPAPNQVPTPPGPNEEETVSVDGDGSSAQVSANPSDNEAEGEAEGEGDKDEGAAAHSANAKKRKNKKKKKAKKS